MAWGQPLQLANPKLIRLARLTELVPRPVLAVPVVSVTKKVGWMPEWGPGFRHDPKDLERRIRLQRGNTFNRRWFDEFNDAIDAVIEKAAETKSAKQRAALYRAAEVATDAVIVADVPDFAPVLRAAASASRTTASIKACRSGFTISATAIL